MNESNMTSVSIQSANSVERNDACFITSKDLLKQAEKMFKESLETSEQTIKKSKIIKVLEKICSNYSIIDIMQQSSSQKLEEYRSCFEEEDISLNEFIIFIKNVFKITESHTVIAKDTINITPNSNLIQKIKLEIMVVRSNNMTKDIQEEDEIFQQTQGRKEMLKSKWHQLIEQRHSSMGQSTEQYQKRVQTDAKYLDNHVVRRTGSIVSVYTSIDPSSDTYYY